MSGRHRSSHSRHSQHESLRRHHREVRARDRIRHTRDHKPHRHHRRGGNEENLGTKRNPIEFKGMKIYFGMDDVDLSFRKVSEHGKELMVAAKVPQDVAETTETLQIVFVPTQDNLGPLTMDETPYQERRTQKRVTVGEKYKFFVEMENEMALRFEFGKGYELTVQLNASDDVERKELSEDDEDDEDASEEQDNVEQKKNSNVDDLLREARETQAETLQLLHRLSIFADKIHQQVIDLASDARSRVEELRKEGQKLQNTIALWQQKETNQQRVQHM